MTRIIITLIGAIALIAFSHAYRQPTPQASPVPPPARAKGYVLQTGEGEKLADPRGGIIKVSPDAGSKQLAMVVQPLPIGKKIGVHRHEREEEVFFVHKGKGTAILGDERTPVGEGSVVYIPPGTWHGFEAGEDMQLVWLISPPHFVELYRMFFKPGLEPTKEEEEKLLHKYGFSRKPPK